MEVVMSKDIITLSTFSIQDRWVSNKQAGKKFIDEQITNILEMKKSFDEAAIQSGRDKPTIVLSALMIPQWKRGDSYTDQTYQTIDYLTAKNEYFDYLKEKCEASGIVLEDFYSNVATPDEKLYLHRLEALGSNADLIKNRAIINNKGNRHLQLDTNTIIVDKKAFYKATIGSDSQKDGMNASYYDDSGLYVSPHNKVVYTNPNSIFVENLTKSQNAYVSESKNNPDRKTPSSNQIYSVCFSKAAMDTGLTNFQRKYYQQWNNLWGYYPVNLDNPTFKMTKHIITAINMSWSQGEGKVDYCSALKGLKVEVLSDGDEKTTLDFQSFAYLIKKYTNEKLSDEDREKLLALSDTDYDARAIEAFFKHVVSQKNIALLGPLLRTIPETTRGKELREKLFKTVKDNPDFLTTVTDIPLIATVTPTDLEELAKFIPENNNLDAQRNHLLSKKEELFTQRKNELRDNLVTMKQQIYENVKKKLDTLGFPYTVTDEDKIDISQAVDDLVDSGITCLTLDQIKQSAQSLSEKKVLNNRLKLQPEVLAACKQAEPSINNIISRKLYSPPMNEKFNRAEIDAMVGRIVFDVKVLNADKVKEAFFKSDFVTNFITDLDRLAAIRPMNDVTEAQVEQMSKALVTTVKEIIQNPNVVLKEHINSLEIKMAHPTIEIRNKLAAMRSQENKSEEHMIPTKGSP